MARIALLVSEQRMKDYTALDNNTRTEEITPFILNAQDVYIQDTLGTKFYDELKDGVVNGTLTSDEQTLLNDYIAQPLMHFALYLMLPTLKYKIVEKGLLSGTSEETQPTTLEELQYVRQSERDLAEFYMERLREYLKDNPGMFPSYDNYGVDGMAPNKENPYFSGLVTTGVKRYKTYYENKCDECNPDLGPSS